MRKLLAVLVLVVLVFTACHDTIGPDPRARQHVIKTLVVGCPNTMYNLQVSWVEWEWQAIFLNGARQIANVTNTNLTKNSGCIYVSGDKARVKLVPLGSIAKYLDSAFVDVTIQPVQ